VARLDKIHEIVKTALIKDGWTITADPFAIQFEELDLYVDLAAERVFAAERENEKIAVEIKSFLLPSKIQDFKLALGQHELYKEYMAVLTPDRKLFLAIGEDIFKTFFQKKAVQFIINHKQMPLIIVNLNEEEIVEWIN
jgi:XisH protein